MLKDLVEHLLVYIFFLNVLPPLDPDLHTKLWIGIRIRMDIYGIQSTGLHCQQHIPECLGETNRGIKGTVS